MRDFDIDSDLKQEKFQSLKLVQGDRGNKIKINVYEDGQPVNLTGCSITAKYKRSDGEIVDGTVENISDNSFYAVMNSDITKVSGTLKMIFSIEKDDVKVSAFLLLADIREGIGENTGSSGGSTGGGSTSEVTIDLSEYYKKSETYSKAQIDSQFKKNQINIIEDDTSMEGISDSVHDNLTTTNKKIIPAINEINSFLEDNIISIKVYNNDLKSAILNSNKKQIIDLRNKKITYSNSEDILIDSRILANGIIEVTGGAKIILKNENSILHNLKIINKCESNGLNNGIIELLNTTDAIISNVEMELSTKYSGIFCKTRAKNTRINNLKINGNLRYGILFNDSCTEQGATFRIVDGVDYSDATIGSGLYINNYIYKNTVSADDNTYDGDGIELNCPDYGFSDVRINNADIDNARHIGGASGMALGFANCKNMSFYNINSRNCGFDGIHFENKCENVYVYNLYINECSRGINIGSCKNINIINAVVDNCTIWLAMSNLHSNNEEIKLQNVVFDSNKIGRAHV